MFKDLDDGQTQYCPMCHEYVNQIEELSKIIQCKTGTIATLVEENKRLKKEIKLHDCIDKWGIRECHCACRCLGNEFCTDAEKKINEFKTKLEKIKEAITTCLTFHTCQKCKFYKECEMSLEEFILEIIRGEE